MKFFQAIIILFYSINALSQPFTPQEITQNTTKNIHVVDLDSDGNLDIVGASNNDRISWYRNIDNQAFVEIIISTNTNAPQDVYVIDIDADNDLDVLSASTNDNKIAWYQNDGNQNFSEFIISTDLTRASYIYATDIDLDGDMDVIGASAFVNDNGGLAYGIIRWYQNDGNQNFSEIEIDNPNPLTSFEIADMDGDGDMDIISSSGWSNKVYWYENGEDQVFTEHTAYLSSPGQVRDIFIYDIDGDSDMDILSANSSGSNKYFSTLINDGNQNFISTNIRNVSNTVNDIYGIDLDQDGDLDILSSLFSPGKMNWFQNTGDQSFIELGISAGWTTNDFYPVDFDQDGDNDIIASSSNGIIWYERPNTIDEDWDGFTIDVDCDDTNSLVNPQAEEILNNGLDDDCDGDEYILAPVGSSWCLKHILAAEQDFENYTGAIITSDSLLFAVSQFDDLVIYDLDNNYLNGWDIDGAPISLSIDTEENIYVGINGGSNLVEKYDKQGNLLQTFSVFGEANDLIIDEDFNVFVTNQCVDEINVFNTDGTLSATWEYDGPIFITEDSADFLYIGALNGGVDKFSKNGDIISNWSLSYVPSTGFNEAFEYNPWDNRFYLLRSEGSSDVMYVYDVNGIYLYNWTFPFLTLGWGQSISFSPNNDMVIADWSNGWSNNGEGIVVYERSGIFVELEIQNFSSCEGELYGSINPVKVDGCGSLEYTLSPNLPFDQLPPGNYELTISLPEGNSMIDSFSILDLSLISIESDINNADTGANNGSILLTISGGNPPFSYLWNDINNSNASIITDLAPGEYIVTVTDANNCSYSEAFSVGGLGADSDNDGFFYSEDCDDDDPDINPMAEEIPNNDIDENCDDIILIIDNDNDGFNSDEDCNDENPAINPDADEIPYNGIDEDCNDLTLDDDLDEDGFLFADDCDDENPAINNDAIEIPNNGIDEDCDGEDLISATHELNGQLIHVYPNPVGVNLTIKLDGIYFDNLIVKIFSIEGTLIYIDKLGNNRKVIDLSDFSDGLYFLELSDTISGKRTIESIVKIN